MSEGEDRNVKESNTALSQSMPINPPTESQSILQRRRGRAPAGEDLGSTSKNVSAGDVELDQLSQQLEKAFNIDQNVMPLSSEYHSEGKGKADKPKVPKTLTISVEPRGVTDRKCVSGMKSVDSQRGKITSHTSARTAKRGFLSKKSPGSVKSSKSDSFGKVVKYVRSPGDYVFLDLDGYESIGSDDGAGNDIDVPSEESFLHDSEYADSHAKSEKSAKKRGRKWLKQRLTARKRNEADLLSGFDDASSPGSSRSFDTSSKRKGKTSKLRDSCSNTDDQVKTDSMEDLIGVSNRTSSVSSTGQRPLVKKENSLKKKNASKDKAYIALRKKIEDIREETGTRVIVLSPKYYTPARRVDDDRAWGSRNLRCTHCLGECPICHTACCVYEEARRKAFANPENSASDITSAAAVIKTIEELGSHVKDTSTFSICTQPGGCGRLVCPDCSGVCPSQVCEDIQCKECKPDPWDLCDWHDFLWE